MVEKSKDPLVEAYEQFGGDLLEAYLHVKGIKKEDAWQKSIDDLRELSFKGVPITDEAMPIIGKYVKCTKLIFDGSREPINITDAGLEHLSGMTELWRLDFCNASITGSGLRFLDDLDKLEMLVLYECPITDEGLSHLPAFPALTDLSLSGDNSRITDAALKYVSRCTALEDITLHRVSITGSGLADLAPLRKVKILSLCSSGITDEGLAGISSIRNLKDVFLKHTKVTDECLVHLSKLKKLHGLDLEKTKVTGRGLEVLAEAKNLVFLNLLHCPITDEGLSYLPPLPKLRYLRMNGIQITDEGLKHLHQFPKLNEVTLTDTLVTRQGVLALKEVFPKCKIEMPQAVLKEEAAARAEARKKRKPKRKTKKAYADVRIDGETEPRSQAELDRFETETGILLPASYREFMTRFGAGEFTGAWSEAEFGGDLEICAPLHSSEHFRLQRPLGEEAYDFLNDKELRGRMIWFASEHNGDQYGWDPEDVTDEAAHECAIYVDMRHKDGPEKIASTFREFIEDYCFGGGYYEVMDFDIEMEANPDDKRAPKYSPR